MSEIVLKVVFRMNPMGINHHFYFLFLMGCLSGLIGCQPDPIRKDNTLVGNGPVDNVLSQAEKAEGWSLLFDGASLGNASIYNDSSQKPERWGVKAGSLYLLPRPEGSKSKEDLIITTEPIDDFEFAFDWKVEPGGNSGIFYRTSLDTRYEKPWHTGLEMQLLDNALHKEGKIETHKAGDLYDLFAAKEGVVKAGGQWNHSRILVVGGMIQHWMNGEEVLSVEIGSDAWNRQVSKSKYASLPDFAKFDQGHILLQDHGDALWFKNLKIRTR